MSERVLLLQLDGHESYDEERPGLPNLACLRIAGHHRAAGDEVVFRCVGSDESDDVLPDGTSRSLWGEPQRFDRVYASAMFTRTRPLVERVLASYPHAFVGGTG